MSGGRSSSGDAGATAEANALQQQAQARLSRITEQGFAVDISNVIGIVGQQLQEFDVGMGRQMGATSLQIARSGAMSRTRRNVAYDETMGINKFSFQDNLGAERDTLSDELDRLIGEHETLKANADYGLVQAAIDAADELNHADPGQFTETAPNRDDFMSVNRSRYQSALDAYNDCLEAEQEAERRRRREASDRGGFDDTDEGRRGGNTRTVDGDREERVSEEEAAEGSGGGTKDASGEIQGL